MTQTSSTPWQNAAHRVYSDGGLRVQIVRARPADAGALTAIAYAAKRYWDYPLRWLEAWREELTIRPEFIAAHAQAVYAAVIDERMIGFYALACVDRQATLEHLWVLPEAIGQGIGRVLFEHAVQQARDLGAQTLAITADPNAAGFYMRMGARRVGEKVYQLEGQWRRLPQLALDIAKT
jgi:GNAT superfamily N-acetyltransferase